MIREKTMRALSLLVLVAGCAAIVGAAGAQSTVVPEHHVRVAVAPASIPVRRETRVVSPATATPIERARVTKPIAAPRLTLPRSLTADMLPAGTQLPTPAATPSNPWAARQPTRLGQIVIPAIGLDQPFFEGIDQAAFEHGVGHWPGTAAPGGWGNAVFGGHRVTEARPFFDMDKLRAGNEVDFVMANGWTYVYRVTKVFVVPNTAMWIADQAPGRTLTMFTCHPKGSASERLVTSGALARVVAPT
jgi:LPXTG-site transpeptidase (sortase) family protein